MKCYNSIVVYFKFCTLRRLLSCEVKCFLHPVESISAPNIRFFLLHFFTRNPLRKTAKSKHFNTQPLSQHCPTDRLHTRFSFGIACCSSVNKNLTMSRIVNSQRKICNRCALRYYPLGYRQFDLYGYSTHRLMTNY